MIKNSHKNSCHVMQIIFCILVLLNTVKQHLGTGLALKIVPLYAQSTVATTYIIKCKI